jgi:hypothetical protein
MSDTKACPFCGEQILAVAVKCKHCRSMLGPRTWAVTDVPWYRRATVMLPAVLLLPPAAALVLLTGPVYRVKDGKAFVWRGWGPALANFVSLSICILAGVSLFEAMHRPDCRSGQVAELLGELAQRQVVEAQGLLAAAQADAQAGLKLSVSIDGARAARPGEARQCVATARLRVSFPRLDEPVEGTAELKYAVDPAGWAKVYVHVADAEWIQAAFGQAREKYVQRLGPTR